MAQTLGAELKNPPGAAFSDMAVAPDRRRCRGKQPTPAAFQGLQPPQPPNLVALRALADESWSELTSLDESVKRKHIHWTHIRTRNPPEP